MVEITAQEAQLMAETRIALDSLDAIGMIERACEGDDGD